MFQSSFRFAVVLQELRNMVAVFIASSMDTPLFRGWRRHCCLNAAGRVNKT